MGTRKVLTGRDEWMLSGRESRYVLALPPPFQACLAHHPESTPQLRPLVQRQTFMISTVAETKA